MGSTILIIVGLLELALIFAFVLGVKKTFTYGAVLALDTKFMLSQFS